MKSVSDRTELMPAEQTQLAQMVVSIRPELHRYCAGLLGSVIDGEDVVQDALANAFAAFPSAGEVPNLRAWLFRIAHNRAVDALRARTRSLFDPLEELGQDLLEIADSGEDAEEALVRSENVALAMSEYAKLPPAQRAAVLLKDVLGYSLEEIAGLFGNITANAVKALLKRGRTNLANLRQSAAPRATEGFSEQTLRFAKLFNAREWNELRDLLAEDVRLEQVSRSLRAGRKDVGILFTNYDRLHNWRLVPAWLEGREVLALVDPLRPAVVSSFMLVDWRDDEIAAIRDYRHLPYIARDAAFSF